MSEAIRIHFGSVTCNAPFRGSDGRRCQLAAVGRRRHAVASATASPLSRRTTATASRHHHADADAEADDDADTNTDDDANTDADADANADVARCSACCTVPFTVYR